MRIPNHKTKIVATIGPSSNKKGVLESMVRAGMNVARINFAHGTLEDHARTVRLIREISQKLERRIAILGDIPGVKIRVGNIEGGFIELRKGERLILTVEESMGEDGKIPVDYPDFPRLVSRGDRIYLSDGFIVLKVQGIQGNDVICKVLSGGKLFSHKGINVPHTRIDVETLTPRDYEILEFMIEMGIDAVGVSFVGKEEDVLKVKKFVEKFNSRVFVISKIERPIAIKNFDAILRVSDGIMIARGDLGVETPIEKLPILQKRLIKKAKMMGKPVITATQMLESMTLEKMPTRAEVTDVANAIIDGTDAVMLSEETAVGKYPVESIRMMSKIARTTENYLDSMWEERVEYWKFRGKRGEMPATIKDAIARSVIAALNTVDIKYILTPTKTGETPRLISRFRPRQWILAFTNDKWVANTLLFSYGVYPIVTGERSEDRIIEVLKKERIVKENDTVLLTEGTPIGKTVGTNTLRIFKIA
jgi:pyruvate kinase